MITHQTEEEGYTAPPFESLKAKYRRVINGLLEQMERGTIPWRRPWNVPMPRNIWRKRYHGINILLLSAAPFHDPRWLTRRQVERLGGCVRDDEAGMFVVGQWPIKRASEDTGETAVDYVPCCYEVFNVEQCEGLRLRPFRVRQDNPIQACVRFIASQKDPPRIQHYSLDRTCYSPSRDLVEIPFPSFFDSDAEYYAALFHELVHASGHGSRLKRKGIAFDAGEFGTDDYSQEELVAEIGASFLCQEMGILPARPQNHAAYLDFWLRVLKRDELMLQIAASQAQKACDYLLNRFKNA